MATADDGPCEPRQSDVSSGPALLAYLQSLPDDTCINPLFDGPEGLRLAAFREETVIHVMQAASALGTTYDGTNSTNLTAIYYFFRAAYYNDWYNDEIDFSTDVDHAMLDALDEFIQNEHFYDATNDHGLVLTEVFVCLDSLGGRGRGYRPRHLPVVKDWFATFDARYARHWNLLGATNRLFFWLFRGHWNHLFLEAALDDEELMSLLRDLALSDSLLDGARHPGLVELILANAARELTRFLEYDSASVHTAVQVGVRSILDRYDPLGEGARIWMGAADIIDDVGVCDDFDICDTKAEIEATILSIDHACRDSIDFRVQSLTAAQLRRACGKLGGVDTSFHEQLGTGYEHLPGDLSSTLEIVVFAAWDQYDLYSGWFFGNDTDNGGIYLEGDPWKPGNTARFIAYVADWLPDRPVWNLEHEYVHYLDGRFNLAGAFRDYKVDTHNTVWWLEGLAEYISKGGGTEGILEYATRGVPPLSEVFAITYSGQSLYAKSHLAMWYMFQGRRGDLDVFLDFFRAGDYDAYLEYISEFIGEEYDDEWERWIEDPGAVPKRFRDDPIRPGVTPVRAVHFTELRARIDDLREAGGLRRFVWTDPVLTAGVTPMRRVHLLELREALAEAYRAAGRPAPRWTDAEPRAGVTRVRAVHLTELRAAVVELE